MQKQNSPLFVRDPLEAIVWESWTILGEKVRPHRTKQGSGNSICWVVFKEKQNPPLFVGDPLETIVWGALDSYPR